MERHQLHTPETELMDRQTDMGEDTGARLLGNGTFLKLYAGRMTLIICLPLTVFSW